MGVQVVWDVDPEKRTVVVHQSESEPRTYSENDTLTEPILLPGFEMPVKSMFQW
jgi:Uma2 family endonuclease